MEDLLRWVGQTYLPLPIVSWEARSRSTPTSSRLIAALDHRPVQFRRRTDGGVARLEPRGKEKSSRGAQDWRRPETPHFLRRRSPHIVKHSRSAPANARRLIGPKLRSAWSALNDCFLKGAIMRRRTGPSMGAQRTSTISFAVLWPLRVKSVDLALPFPFPCAPDRAQPASVEPNKIVARS
jgi:hypothetical protein